ncbi:hypothetical protein LRS03_00415 [Rhizobacter sp. J219]|uniref:hypothetical protein n=1 Tax=Rhizobacter sp. J219 TaxID=2898430 RepID=UPI0021509056|nr:hypothetical protein [Rhizobacter sp. J219]MCR5881408.1 hypothetical protein [Rhizobacter sp. J219]
MGLQHAPAIDRVRALDVEDGVRVLYVDQGVRHPAKRINETDRALFRTVKRAACSSNVDKRQMLECKTSYLPAADSVSCGSEAEQAGQDDIGETKGDQGSSVEKPVG